MSENVATVEDKLLRDYELVIVINPEITEDGLETVLNGINQYITDKGGVVSNVERWGKKKLAYPIKHFLEGIYILTRFKLRPSYGRELEANLRISDEVLRHLLIKVE